MVRNPIRGPAKPRVRTACSRWTDVYTSPTAKPTVYVYSSRTPRSTRVEHQGVQRTQSVRLGDEFLTAAIDEARDGEREGGIPIGSVLVHRGRIIGRGHNQR